MNHPFHLQIQNMLMKTRNPHHIAAAVGCPIALVRDYMRTVPQDYLLGWGRVELQPHIVSRMGPSGWPLEDRDLILRMRKEHDLGRINLTQTRDGVFFVLYALPNEKPVKRPPYFFPINPQ